MHSADSPAAASIAGPTITWSNSPIARKAEGFAHGTGSGARLQGSGEGDDGCTTTTHFAAILFSDCVELVPAISSSSCREFWNAFLTSKKSMKCKTHRRHFGMGPPVRGTKLAHLSCLMLATRSPDEDRPSFPNKKIRGSCLVFSRIR
jgi:hypothetical protein